MYVSNQIYHHSVQLIHLKYVSSYPASHLSTSLCTLVELVMRWAALLMMEMEDADVAPAVSHGADLEGAPVRRIPGPPVPILTCRKEGSLSHDCDLLISFADTLSKYHHHHFKRLFAYLLRKCKCQKLQSYELHSAKHLRVHPQFSISCINLLALFTAFP